MDDSTKAKLEAAQARLKAAEAELQAFDEAVAETEAVEITEQKAADLEALAEARKKYGKRRVTMVETDMGGIILKCPDPILFKRWQDSEHRTSVQSLEQLAIPCVIHPDKKTNRLDKILDDQPATIERLADAACYLAGWRKEDTAKK